MQIESRVVGSTNPPYIIAEMSANHNGSLEVAKQTILMAQKCGADAVKMQSYSADTMTLDSNRQNSLSKKEMERKKTLRLV